MAKGYKSSSRPYGSGRVTTTVSSDGKIRQTYSSGTKNYKQSFSSKTGVQGQRLTTTTRMNGWTTRTQKTIGTSRPRIPKPLKWLKEPKSRSRRSSGSTGSGWIWVVLLLIVLFSFSK